MLKLVFILSFLTFVITTPAIASTATSTDGFLGCFQKVSKVRVLSCLAVNVGEVVVVDFAMCWVSQGTIKPCLPVLQEPATLPVSER